MKLYLCFLDKIPYMVYTDYTEALKFSKEVIEIEGMEIVDQVYVMPENYKLFINHIDAIYYATKNNIKEFYICGVDIFMDVDIFELDLLFQLPLEYINNLELKYRIYNKYNAKKAFKEAKNMYNIFSDENMRILRLFITKYPEFSEQYQENFKQHNALHLYETRESMLNDMY